MSEKERLSKIADFYYSKEMTEAVDHFHIYLREITIPEEGGHSALELGCGKGRWTTVLCERYQEVDVVDAAFELVEKVTNSLKNKGAKITGHVNLIEDFLDSTNCKWEHIFLSMLLEHVENPVDILSKVKRVCNPSGTLFIAIPNATSIHRMVALRAGLIKKIDELSINDQKVGHRRVYNLEMIKQQLKDAGFIVSKIIPVGLKAITHEQMKQLPDKILWSLCRSGDLVPDNPAYWVIHAKIKT